jgi:hypothetical protein
MDCPWHSFKQDTMRFCEGDVCGLIRFPADAYSMIVLLVVGVMILFSSKGEGVHLRFMASMSIALSIGSFVYHATGTYFGQLLDLMGMYLFSVYYLYFAAQRILNFSFKTISMLYLSTLAVSLAVLLMNADVGILLFTIQFIGSVLLEVYLYRKSGRSVAYKNYFKAISCFGVGYAFWVLDFERILCNPDNHILTGHGIWHILSAVAIWYSYRFLRQFDGVFAKHQ